MAGQGRCDGECKVHEARKILEMIWEHKRKGWEIVSKRGTTQGWSIEKSGDMGSYKT